MTFVHISLIQEAKIYLNSSNFQKLQSQFFLSSLCQLRMKGAVTLFDILHPSSRSSPDTVCVQRVALFAFACRTLPSARNGVTSDGAKKTGARTPEVFGHRERLVIIRERRWNPVAFHTFRASLRRTRSRSSSRRSFVCTGCMTTVRRRPSWGMRLKYCVLNRYATVAKI